MPEHLVTNVGPTPIHVIRRDGRIEVIDAGCEITCELQAVTTDIHGKVRFTVEPKE